MSLYKKKKREGKLKVSMNHHEFMTAELERIAAIERKRNILLTVVVWWRAKVCT